MKIFIACSKHFYDRIDSIKKVLEDAGHEVALPNSFDDPLAEERFRAMSREEHVKFKSKMMKVNEENIMPNDAVLVLNFEKRGIPNYIGGATFLEVYNAWKMGKKVFFYNDLPVCSFSDELLGIDPVVIKGDLSLVR
jgi:hypothetical protein